MPLNVDGVWLVIGIDSPEREEQLIPSFPGLIAGDVAGAPCRQSAGAPGHHAGVAKCCKRGSSAAPSSACPSFRVKQALAALLQSGEKKVDLLWGVDPESFSTYTVTLLIVIPPWTHSVSLRRAVHPPALAWASRSTDALKAMSRDFSSHRFLPELTLAALDLRRLFQMETVEG